MSYPPTPPPGGPPPAQSGGPVPFSGQGHPFGAGPQYPGGEAWARPRRPTSVVVAAGILIVMGLVGLGYGIAALVEMPAVVDRFRAATAATGAPRSDVDAVVALIRVGAVLSAVFGAAAALLLGGLALGNLRGANGARIATWAVCAIGVLCGCCGLVVVVVQRAIGLAMTGDEATTRELVAALGAAYPTWWIVLGGTLCLGQAFGYLVVAALLALPAANGFYRMSPVPAPPAPPAARPSPPVPPAAPPPSPPAR